MFNKLYDQLSLLNFLFKKNDDYLTFYQINHLNFF